ncbi:hypothetical protein GCM10025857_23900 [Alicyclobacillus contaminans]|uniref:hypothetical protein n=1 Tax=Alicyclobacillus contaminans TaxID=392016 RepID=UPI00041FE121|nr:hypothetical protein [Alicyclobacillus contaminans]GMA51033.1 hypothetical protein GCM10025857_23900 [Alicyclobacillus contaminans]
MKKKLMESLETEIEDVITGRVHRWPFIIAVLLIGVLLSALSENLTVGPSWTVLVVVCLLSIMNTEEAPDLYFPQMAIASEEWKHWKPSFSDYVFLAFNTSTAFSPTDTMVLSKRTKILCVILPLGFFMCHIPSLWNIDTNLNTL